MIKAALVDFDGTLVRKDILDVICSIVGKEKESERLNKEYRLGLKSGHQSLIERINLLKGVSYDQIKQKLDENPYLTKRAKELIDFLNRNKIVSINYSGNILPILKYYQQLLHTTFVVGTRPKMHNDTIQGISEEDFPDKNAKLFGIKKILSRLSIKPTETLAIGDSLADKPIFEFAEKSIAIDPRGGIDKYAEYVIENDLSLAIPIIEKLLKN